MFKLVMIYFLILGFSTEYLNCGVYPLSLATSAATTSFANIKRAMDVMNSDGFDNSILIVGMRWTSPLNLLPS